ncbi:unnamed protein product, partial [Pylaiella littoralis]
MKTSSKSTRSVRARSQEACVVAGKPADTLGEQLTPPQLEQRARGGHSKDQKSHLTKNDDASEYTIPKKVPIQTRQVFNESVYERLEQQYPDLDGAALGDMYLKEVAAASDAQAQETQRANKKAAFQAQVRLGMQPSAAVAPAPQVAQTEVGLGQVEESPFPSRGGGGGGNQSFSPRGRGGGRFFGGRGGGRFNRGKRFQGGNRGYGGEGSHHYGPQEQAFPFDQPMHGDSRTIYGYPPAHEGERTKRWEEDEAEVTSKAHLKALFEISPRLKEFLRAHEALTGEGAVETPGHSDMQSVMNQPAVSTDCQPKVLPQVKVEPSSTQPEKVTQCVKTEPPSTHSTAVSATVKPTTNIATHVVDPSATVAPPAAPAANTEDSPVDMTKKQIKEIQRQYATYNTGVFMKLPLLPLGEDVNELVQFADTLSHVVEECRLGVGDHSDSQWVRGWDRPVEKHVINAISSSRAGSTQEVLALKRKVNTAFIQTRAQMDKGVQGPQALDFLIRVLSKELSTVSPNAVVSELQNLVVAPGTPFKEYMSTLRSLVQNARSVGHIA